jgi:transmembrane sensor
MQSCATRLYMSINESQFREMLDRYIQGKASAEEAKLLDDFFNSYENERGQQPDLINGRSKQELLSRINSAVNPTQISFWHQGWKIAAAITLIAISVFVIRQNNLTGTDEQVAAVTMTTETTVKGQKSVLTLPDGTVVHLNSGSELTFPKTFANVRKVELKGEAYFDVTHDDKHPFVVTASNSTIKVLGTSFNVKATPSKNTEVTLVAGKVNVASDVKENVLYPGDQAVVDIQTQNIITQKVNLKKFTSWKDNILFFEETSLEDAVEIIESWYDTEITISSKNLKRCTITGQYKDESLENVMKSFEFLLKAKVDSHDLAHITISGKGCN